MTEDQTVRGTAIILGPDEGRSYELGAMRAVFKADEQETDARYSISEWWLEPHSEGPGPHSHDANDDIFYVIEGTVSFLIGQQWVDLSKGSFLRAPAGVRHDFQNRSNQRAGLLNIYIPGGFERDMPAIVEWFDRQKK